MQEDHFVQKKIFPGQLYFLFYDKKIRERKESRSRRRENRRRETKQPYRAQMCD